MIHRSESFRSSVVEPIGMVATTRLAVPCFPCGKDGNAAWIGMITDRHVAAHRTGSDRCRRSNEPPCRSPALGIPRCRRPTARDEAPSGRTNRRVPTGDARVQHGSNRTIDLGRAHGSNATSIGRPPRSYSSPNRATSPQPPRTLPRPSECLPAHSSPTFPPRTRCLLR